MLLWRDKLKLIDLYNSVKEQYLDVVVLMKSGNFYITYNNDALILNYLLHYKKINDKVGFPLSALKTVENKLNEKSISYIVAEEKEDIKQNNNYYIYMQKANENLIIDNMCANLLNKIKEKVAENFDNYKQIKEYIDEL